MANPSLADRNRADLVGQLMGARRAVRDAKRAADPEAEATAHRAVDEVKQALGERGPVWWDDGSPDLNRHMAHIRPMPTGTPRSGAPAPEDPELPKAAIFDVDGTLLDSVDLHALAWQEAMVKFGHDVGFEQVRGQIGKGGDKLIPHFLSEDAQRDHGREMEEWRGKRFKSEYLPLVRPFSAVPDLLRRVKDASVRIAVASSAKKNELDKYLDIAGTLLVPSGPDSAAIATILTRLCVAIDSVEDTRVRVRPDRGVNRSGTLMKRLVTEIGIERATPLPGSA